MCEVCLCGRGHLPGCPEAPEEKLLCIRCQKMHFTSDTLSDEMTDEAICPDCGGVCLNKKDAKEYYGED